MWEIPQSSWRIWTAYYLSWIPGVQQDSVFRRDHQEARSAIFRVLVLVVLFKVLIVDYRTKRCLYMCKCTSKLNSCSKYFSKWFLSSSTCIIMYICVYSYIGTKIDRAVEKLETQVHISYNILDLIVFPLCLSGNKLPLKSSGSKPHLPIIF